jgi:hypothetical protein
MPVDLVITDGDDTAFPKGGEEPYPGTLEFLERVQPAYVFLVSVIRTRNLLKDVLKRLVLTGSDS